jgi:hypothetical protein
MAVFFMTLFACLHVKYPSPGEPIDTEENEALVFGKVKVIDRGYEINPWSFDLVEALSSVEKPEIKLSLFLIEANQRGIYVIIEPDGSFYWIVPRGTYLIYHSRIGQQPVNEPLAAFQVTDDAHAVYLGTMAMHIESSYNRESERQEYEVTNVRIEDEFDKANKGMIFRYPDFVGTMVKKLMVHDSELRSLFQDYSQRKCGKILSRHDLHLMMRDREQKK